jgi:hypothetical protein
VILAALLSRAINGSAAFCATLGGGVVLVSLHRVFAFLTFYSHRFGILVKGRPDVIVRDGQCDVSMMLRNHVSTHHLSKTCVLAYTRTTCPVSNRARGTQRRGQLHQKINLTQMAYDLMELSHS